MSYIETLFNVKGKTAVLTGGAGILASEMAKGLLHAGAQVVLLDINEEKLTHKVTELQRISPVVFGYRCDVLNEKSVEEVHTFLHEKKIGIDILINAAGGNVPSATLGINQTIFDLSIDNLRKGNDLNFWGTVIPTLIFGKTMAEKKKGSIINISSMASFRVISRVMGYSAAKAAIDNFTKWMAVELASKYGNGIRVNAIAPGFLLTEQNRTLLTTPDGSLTERGKAVIAMTPYRRFGEPEELIGTVLWLASDASKFVTGVVVPVDGGFNINSGV